MKKALLIALTLVPFAAGYLVELAFPVPGFGSAVFYLLPLAAVSFQLWLGRQYAKTGWGPGRALLLGNAVGLVSLAIYLWQFEGQSAQTRDPLLAGLCQMVFSAAPQYLLGPVAALLPHSVTALMLLSFLLMAAVFAWGFFTGRKAK